MKITEYIKNVLSEFGLSEGEIVVYMAILERSERDAFTLKNLTRYSLAGVYKILDSLIYKNFICAVKKGRTKVYMAVSLTDLAKKFSSRGRKLSDISDRLRGIAKNNPDLNSVEVYEGRSLEDYYLNIPYRVDDSLWCIGSFEAVLNFFGEGVEKDFIRTRVKNGRSANALIFDTSNYCKDLALRDIKEKRETRIVPSPHYPLEFSYLFGNTMIDFYRDDDNKVRILKLESSQLAKAKLFQYQALWNSTKQ